MSDTNLNAGDNADAVAAGKGNQQSRQQANPRQNMRGGDTYYGSGQSEREPAGREWIIAQINDHAQQIRELTYRLDDLPSKVNRLEGRVDTQTDKVNSQDDRVKRLEDLEVVVRKESVVVRPVLPPDSVDISMRTLTILFLIVGTLILCAVVYLVYLQGLRSV